MKKLNEFIVGVLIALLFWAVSITSAHPAESTTMINETQIVSNSEVQLKFVRMENTGVSFQFVGLSISCVQPVEVIGLAIYNDEDSSYIPTNLYDTFSQLADTCIIQVFCFAVHGGQLRRQINKDGLAIIYIISDAHQAYKLQLTEFGEQEIIRVLDNK